jgi:hypothetical protein
MAAPISSHQRRRKEGEKERVGRGKKEKKRDRGIGGGIGGGIGHTSGRAASLR